MEGGFQSESKAPNSTMPEIIDAHCVDAFVHAPETLSGIEQRNLHGHLQGCSGLRRAPKGNGNSSATLPQPGRRSSANQGHSASIRFRANANDGRCYASGLLRHSIPERVHACKRTHTNVNAFCLNHFHKATYTVRFESSQMFRSESKSAQQFPGADAIRNSRESSDSLSTARTGNAHSWATDVKDPFHKF